MGLTAPGHLNAAKAKPVKVASDGRAKCYECHDEVKALKPTLNAFKSILAGGRYQGNVAEFVMAIDIDMDKVNFELLGKVLGAKRSAVSDPSRSRAGTPAKPQTRPQTRTPASPQPQNPKRHQTGL
ncbi:MAG: hypothetical protein CVV27_18130 [Candidatus Melainabacteria bacterium HGW-Melainabacteria-1]|nr:MAG: hypothetical protein CVV27_18130 [Candidatus Melainabacteria bacterium HGW-Melainabacteria-1]